LSVIGAAPIPNLAFSPIIEAKTPETLTAPKLPLELFNDKAGPSALPCKVMAPVLESIFNIVALDALVILKEEALLAVGDKSTFPCKVKFPAFVCALLLIFIGAAIPVSPATGFAVGATQAPLEMNENIKIKTKTQPLIAKKKIERFFCSILFF